MTLLSNLQAVLDLAKWPHWLASTWADFVEPVVIGAIRVLGLRVSSDAGMLIAMAIFVSAVAIGSRLENAWREADAEDWPIRWSNIFNYRVALAIILYVAEVVLVSVALLLPAIYEFAITHPILFTAAFTGLYLFAIVIGLRGWPPLYSVTVALCLLAFSNVFAYSAPHRLVEPNVSHNVSAAVAAVFAIGCGLTIVGIAPPRSFTRRLVFMIIGTALIVALSELSRFGLEATPSA